MFYGTVVGKPGIYAGYQATHRAVMKGAPDWWLPGGATISGTASRDPGNAPDVGVLRPGLILGKITASGKLAPSFIDVTQAAAAASATTITLTAAGATELVRRVGATGNLRLTGPPSAGGTVAVSAAVAYSAVNTTNGNVTTAALPAAYVAGSYVSAADGSENPLTFVWDGWGIPVLDFNQVSQDVDMGKLPIGGSVRAVMLIPWPTDTAQRDWLRDILNKNGKYVLDYAFLP